jgi:hypothetical protein
MCFFQPFRIAFAEDRFVLSYWPKRRRTIQAASIREVRCSRLKRRCYVQLRDGSNFWFFGSTRRWDELCDLLEGLAPTRLAPE